LRLRWDAERLRLEVLVAPRPKGDFLVFASAPCSPGWSRMRRPVYLGLLPAPVNGISDITPLYLARFRAPEPGEQVFIQTRQHRHGWEGPAATHSALVPPTPAPLPPCPHTPRPAFPTVREGAVGAGKMGISLVQGVWGRGEGGKWTGKGGAGGQECGRGERG